MRIGEHSKTIGYIINETAPPIDGVRAKVVGEKYGHLIVEAVLQDIGVTNRNKRYYAEEELVPELTCKRQQELIKSGNMKGENGHPNSKELIRQQTIDPNNTCCKFLKLWVDGNKVMAHVTGSFDQKGDEFDRAIRCEELPSFSMRALGTICNTKNGAEVRNIKLITYDRVIYPSHECAYVQEGTELKMEMNESGIYLPKQPEGSRLYLPEDDKGMVTPIMNESVVSYIKSESANLKSVLESIDTLYDSVSILENGNVQLLDKSGSTIIISTEQYIKKEIMDFCTIY